jgi:hypothetical protein
LTQSPSRAHDLALQLLRYEGVSDASDSEVIAAAADRVLQHLRGELARWFGSEGFRAILLRAIDRTCRSYPALAGAIPPLEGPGTSQHGLDNIFGKLQPCGAQEARAATVALIAAVIALLDKLVGEDVALRLLSQSWPELVRGEPRSSDEGTTE